MMKMGRVLSKAAKQHRKQERAEIKRKEGDVLTVFRRLDRGEIDVDQANQMLNLARSSRTNRVERLLDALVG